MKRIFHSSTIHSHHNHSSRQNNIENILSTIDSHCHHWVKILTKRIIHTSTIHSHHHHWVKIGTKRIIHLSKNHSHHNHSRQIEIKHSLFIYHRLTPPSLSENWNEENLGTFWPLAFVTLLKFCQWKWGSIRSLHTKFHKKWSKNDWVIAIFMFWP